MFRLLIRLFAGKTFIMLLGLILTILSLGSSLGLLTLAAWFLASCYLVASIDFNIFYPSSSVRGFAIARTVLKYIQRLVTHKATFDVLTKLRIQVFASLLPMFTDVNKMAKFKSSVNSVQMNDNELFDRVIKDIDNLDGFYVNILIPFLGTILLFVAFSIGLAFIDLKLALFIGACLVGITLIVPWIFYPLGKKIAGNVEQESTKLRLAFLNYLELQFENVIFNKENKKVQNLKQLNQNLIKEQLKQDKYVNLTTFILQVLLGVVLTITIFGTSYLQVLHATDLRLPGLALIFIFLIIGSIEFIVPLANLFVHLGQVTSSLKNLEVLLEDDQAEQFAQNLTDIDLGKAVSKEVETQRFYPDQLDSQLVQATQTLGLRVNGLNFNYQQNPVIQNLSFNFSPQESYLISGDSGLGKTTLLNCILGLETSFHGQIYFDLYDQDGKVIHTLEAHSGQQRELCVNLSQRVHIFNDSVFDNLKIANVNLTEEQAKQVLSQVGLDYLTHNLREILGNGGRTLSGGEIRRIGIARVLLSQAKLIILDEPTESVDANLERKMLELIFAHAQKLKATVILVSHNKNNYTFCNSILKMSKLNNQTLLTKKE
ncbi:hypothetical protein CJP74_04640 [Psittacicella melopsittaci]|uniref:Thiol reductant ABC exporter subunit CydC n=1 Tax=Psittacicella melopsittaci TaxID=2028576 RepID=A0A3A1Y2F7_9GAMM|nr:ATP-binding cassette domain-containing protein [Psittacicella melopsittaci]RIY32423.1 hypothetical protein CJP74_04640 [Psittacicella melopsittaci]